MIRLMSIVPILSVGGDEGFREQPLTPDGWREFEKLTDVQRTILRDQHGVWLRIHPHDHAELASIGLDFQRDAEGRPKLQDPLVDLGAKTMGRSVPDSSRPTPDSGVTEEPKTDEGGTTDPVTTINTETPADIGTAGKSKRKDR